MDIASIPATRTSGLLWLYFADPTGKIIYKGPRTGILIFVYVNRQGAAGINAARQLASHGVRTIVYAGTMDSPVIKGELSLYMLTKNRVVNSANDLPTVSDLIIVALCEDIDNPKVNRAVSDWVSRNKAPVLALDPPSEGTPGITPKFSLLPVLPLPHSTQNGEFHLSFHHVTKNLINVIFR